MNQNKVFPPKNTLPSLEKVNSDGNQKQTTATNKK